MEFFGNAPVRACATGLYGLCVPDDIARHQVRQDSGTMDGTLAFLFLALSLTDMGVNHCPTGCLGRQDAQSRLSFSTGPIVFRSEPAGQEIYVRYEFDHSFGPFQPVAGVSLSDDREAWGGIGIMWTQPFLDDRAFVQAHLMPGLYAQGEGIDLGHPVEFRSGVEIGFEANNGWRWSLGIDHRSNADLAEENPGLETVQLRLSIPLN